MDSAFLYLHHSLLLRLYLNHSLPLQPLQVIRIYRARSASLLASSRWLLFVLKLSYECIGLIPDNQSFVICQWTYHANGQDRSASFRIYPPLMLWVQAKEVVKPVKSVVNLDSRIIMSFQQWINVQPTKSENDEKINKSIQFNKALCLYFSKIF